MLHLLSQHELWLYAAVFTFVAVAAGDVCWAVYGTHVHDLNSHGASRWAVGIFVISALATISFVGDNTMLLPASFGAYAGTYVGVEWSKRRKDMIYAHTKDGGIILGVDKVNIERLTKGQPLRLDLRVFGINEPIIMVYGETLQEVQEHLEKAFDQKLPVPSPINNSDTSH